MSKIKTLFWVSVGLLNLSFKIFPGIYCAALETLEAFLSKGFDGFMKFVDLADDKIFKVFPGVLKTVMPSLFTGPLAVQQRSFSVLIMSWTSCGDKFTDPHKSGVFYTHIYAWLWIMTRSANLKATYVLRGKEENVDVVSIVKKFRNLLSSYQAEESVFQSLLGLVGKDSSGVFASLDSIIESLEKNVSIPVSDDRMEKILFAIYRMHLPNCACNLTDFFVAAFTFEVEFRPAVVQMIVSLWKFNRKIDTSKKIRIAIEALIQKLPYLCKEKEFDEILPPILQTVSYSNFKDVDLISKDPAIKFPTAIEPHGSIQDAGDWIKALGIQTSNKFYAWTAS
jgi:hypothetical protein